MSQVGHFVEAIGVVAILIGVLIASARFIWKFRSLGMEQAYHIYRRELARSIILGLELLIAGDIIWTVVVEDSLENVVNLGLIIIIRILLSTTLHVEVEGRWPWTTESTLITKDKTP